MTIVVEYQLKFVNKINEVIVCFRIYGTRRGKLVCVTLVNMFFYFFMCLCVSVCILLLLLYNN